MPLGYVALPSRCARALHQTQTCRGDLSACLETPAAFSSKSWSQGQNMDSRITAGAHTRARKVSSRQHQRWLARSFGTMTGSVPQTQQAQSGAKIEAVGFCRWPGHQLFPSRTTSAARPDEVLAHRPTVPPPILSKYAARTNSMPGLAGRLQSTFIVESAKRPDTQTQPLPGILARPIPVLISPAQFLRCSRGRWPPFINLGGAWEAQGSTERSHGPA